MRNIKRKLPRADSLLPLFFRTFAVGTCVASVTGHFRARLSLARALTRQPVSVFCVHSFTWVLHCVVNEGFEGEGLAFFRFT